MVVFVAIAVVRAVVAGKPDKAGRQGEQGQFGSEGREWVARIRVRSVVDEDVVRDAVILGRLVEEVLERDGGINGAGKRSSLEGEAIVDDGNPNEVVMLDQIPRNLSVVRSDVEDALPLREERTEPGRAVFVLLLSWNQLFTRSMRLALSLLS